MAHLSLYRKFRPDTFDKMVRQEHVVRVLRNQIEQNAVGHAYLFTGPRGTGKTSVARIFARAVNCEHPQNGSPCGQCAVCRALAEGSLDISEIDAASNNGVNEMRDLREKVQYPPVSGRYKVYIVDEVHMLTDSAFNALLKTLEEPPAHVIFILATTEPQKIPATILSRCMRLDFKLIPEEDLEAHLRQVLDAIGKPYEDEAVAAIARAGAGSDRDMLSIAEACIVYQDKLTYEAVNAVLGAADFKETAALVSAVLRADMPSAFSLAESILAEGKSVGVLLRDILQLLSRVTVAKTCRNAEKLLSLPKDFFRTVSEIAESTDGRALLRATEILIRTENELRFASSPRISLEAAIMRIANPETDRDLDALLVRMKKLEERVEELSARPSPATVRPAPALGELPPKKDAEKSPPPVEEAGDAGDAFGFPEEEPVFEEAYFSDGPAPSREEQAPAADGPERTVGKAPEAPAPLPSPPEQGLTAEMAYGKFMRTLRKTSRSGVLFAMCSDLVTRFEGEKLIFITRSETIYTALQREEHRKLMAEALAQIGVNDFEVIKDGAKRADPKDAVRTLKEDFKDYPVEIK